MAVSIYASASNITKTSANVSGSWSGESMAEGAILECNGSTIDSWMYSAGNIRRSLSGSISGLSPNTTYTVSVSMWDAAGWHGSTASFTTLSEPPPPTIYPAPTIEQINLNVLELRPRVYSDYATVFKYELRTIDGAWSENGAYDPNWGTLNRVYVPYYARSYKIRFAGAGIETYWSDWGYFTTNPEPINNPRPPMWSWSYNITSGGPFHSYDSKNAFIMSANEWNNFTANINAVITYMNTKYGYSISTTNFTHVSSGDNVSYDIVGEAFNSINRFRSLDWPDYNKITAKLFNDMKNELNLAT